MKLFYREYGKGIPLIILHGLYGSSDNWISIARSLEDKFRVILPDQRNHGLSPHHPEHNYDILRDDLDELVTELKIEKFILAGHSMGGKSAMWYAKKWPGKLIGLIILDISPFRSPEEKSPANAMHRKILRFMNSIDLSKIESRKEVDNLFSKSVPSQTIRNFLLKNLTRDNKKEFRWKLNPENLENNLENIIDGFTKPVNNLDAITGFPVLFLKAEESQYLIPEDFPDIEKLFPAAEIIEIPNTTHWLHSERPELISGYIKELIY